MWQLNKITVTLIHPFTMQAKCMEVLFLEVGKSGLLTHGRSKDFFGTPLDHYLTLGQQVVFQSLELQGVPISPQRLSSRSYQQVNQSLGSHPSKADHRACNKQHPHSDALCNPRSYLHDNRPERPITPWLARNLTWPTAGKYHSKPFFLPNLWVCHCPLVHANCRLWPSLMNF